MTSESPNETPKEGGTSKPDAVASQRDVRRYSFIGGMIGGAAGIALGLVSGSVSSLDAGICAGIGAGIGVGVGLWKESKLR